MVLSSTLKKALKLSLALMIAAPLVMATDALAQRTKRPPYLSNAAKKLRKPAKIKPVKTESWQKAIDKLYRPANPQIGINKANSTLFRDPGKALGLQSNAISRPTAPNAPVVAPVTLDPAVSHLDINGDGSISRGEYFQGRARLSNLGVKSDRTNQRWKQRLDSQFRRTDLNRDGKVTPEELQSSGGARF